MKSPATTFSEVGTAQAGGAPTGGSAGGVVHRALTRLSSLPPGTTMVTLVNDGGENHTDTVFDDDWTQARDLLDPEAEREIGELPTEPRRNR
ncbi:hypothetical protein [Streptosporangium sp. NPDC002607]